ncbi:hypothetical protein Glove_103g227 [Diversispora epigaea]|uniref:Chitin-binding type-1 domain-containing protein n=1 Tax=Diversispora epigaea TaxID=1348612 RepID=A0A397J3C1_9GLOM|nr:hypothetical protein Glove_103g227 [Diversispora epigaea]
MRQQTSLTIFTILFLIVISILGENVKAQCGKGLPKCPNNLCCSRWGWCGSTSAYCGAGCQPLYGKCPGITTLKTTTTTRKSTTTTPKSTTTTPKTTTTTSKTTTTTSKTSTSLTTTTSKTSTSLTTTTSKTSTSLTTTTSKTSTSLTTTTSKTSTSLTTTTSKTSTSLTTTTSKTSTSLTTTTSKTSTSLTTTTPLTTTVAVPKPSGKPIYSCSVPGTMAITFDDGPYMWTNDLLNNLKALNAKATFFINGNNWDCIYNYATVLKRIVAEGHQLAHHTWGHLDFATLSREQIVFQMTNLENALLKIVGVAPRYMRLPYGSGVDIPLVMDTLTSLGYNVILWDIDTDDWRGLSTQESLNKYRAASKPPGAHIALQHDTIENTAHSLGPEAVKLARSLGFKVTTVGECLGENSSSLWYKKIVTPSAPDGTWIC